MKVEAKGDQWLNPDELDRLEASYKAGYDKRESEFVYNPDYLDFDKGVETGRGLGKREVVEWIEKFELIDESCRGEWQAQKKVWFNEKV